MRQRVVGTQDGQGTSSEAASVQGRSQPAQSQPQLLRLEDGVLSMATAPPVRLTALAAAIALACVGVLAVDLVPRVSAHGGEDHGTVIDLRELHGYLFCLAWGFMIPCHVVLLLYYQWVDPTVNKFLHVHPSWKHLYRLHFIGIVLYIAGFAVVLVAIEQDGGHELEAVDWHRQSHSIGGFAVGAMGLVQEIIPKWFESVQWLKTFHKWNGRLLFVYVFGIQLWTGFVLGGWPGTPLYCWLGYQALLIAVCLALVAASKICPRRPEETFEQQLTLRLRKAGLEIVNPFHVATAGGGGNGGGSGSDSSGSSYTGSDSDTESDEEDQPPRSSRVQQRGSRRGSTVKSKTRRRSSHHGQHREHKRHQTRRGSVEMLPRGARSSGSASDSRV